MTMLLSFAESLPASAVPDAPDAHSFSAAPSAPAPAAPTPAPRASSPALFPLRVELRSWKPLREGTLVGLATVSLPEIGMLILGCKVKTNGYVLIPARRTDGEDSRWCPIVTFADQHRWDAFSAAVVAAIMAVDRNAFSNPPVSHNTKDNSNG